MGKDIKKFVNLKFLKTIDLGLMRELIERHAVGTDGFDLTALDGDAADARSKLTEYFKGPAGNWSEGWWRTCTGFPSWVMPTGCS